MFFEWKWIAILVILVIAYILSPNDKDKAYYKNYDCYDKSPYKCGKCNKKCKCRHIVQKYEELQKERED